MTVKLGASLDWGTIRKVFSKEVYLTLVSVRGGLIQAKS